jgi:hypothetical protein
MSLKALGGSIRCPAVYFDMKNMNPRYLFPSGFNVLKIVKP